MRRTKTMETPRAVKSILDGMRRGLEFRRAHPTFPSTEMYYELMIKYYEAIARAKEEGKLLCGHSVMLPIELFYAMDIVPLHFEMTTMAVQFEGSVVEFLNLASGYGLPVEVCSPHRVLASFFLKEALPPFDMVVYSSMVCDNTLKSGEALAHLYKCPNYFLDRPHSDSPAEFAYYLHQVKELIKFLEEHTGRKLDMDRLKETVKISEEAMRYYKAIYHLRKAVPYPMRNREYFRNVQIEWTSMGLPEAVDYFRQVHDEIKEMVDNKRGACPDGERYRLICLFVPPMFDMKILDWMEREHRAMVVMDTISIWPMEEEMDLDKPIESLARKAFYRPIARQFHGPMDNFITDTVSNAIEFKADGAIFLAHIGCRQGDAAIRILRDALWEKAGIPTLIVDCDNLDTTYTSPDEVKSKLEGFFEQIDESR